MYYRTQGIEPIFYNNCRWSITFKKCGRDLQDGGGVRHGDHLPSHEYIRNTSTCGWENSYRTPTERWQKTSDFSKGKNLPMYLAVWMTGYLLVLQPGVRPVPLRWESRVQDMGPPETSWLHVISNGESSPRELHLNTKTQLHSTTSKLQCWTPYAKQLAKQENNHTHSREAA